MSHLALYATEKDKDAPILIIDKKGIIGERLANKLKQDFTIVFVSNRALTKQEEVVHIPFAKNKPSLPDNKYSQIIIINDDNTLDKKFLEKLLKKSTKENINLFLGINHQFLNEKLFETTVLKCENLKLAVFGDIFAHDFIYSSNSEITKMILSVKQAGKINIPNEGTKEVLPVLLNDVIDAIMQICFSPNKEKIYYILPKISVSTLSLATMFKKSFPEVKLDFYKDKTNIKFNKIMLKGNYVMGENYDISGKINKISFEKINHFVTAPKPKERVRKSPVFYTSLFFLILLILPITTTLLCFIAGKAAMGYSVSKMNYGDNKKAEMFANASEKLMYISLASANMLEQEVKIFGKENIAKPLNDKANNYYFRSKTYYNFLIFLNKINTLVSGESKDSIKDLNTASMALNNSYYNFNFTKNTFDNEKSSEKLSNIFKFTSSTINFWPSILGFNNERNYLVLLRDQKKGTNSGVFSDYVLLKINKGKITKLSPHKNLLSNMHAPIITSEFNKENKTNGIIIVDNNLMPQIKQYLQDDNLVTIGLLDLFVRGTKQKQINVFLDEDLEQAVLITNDFSTSGLDEKRN